MTDTPEAVGDAVDLVPAGAPTLPVVDVRSGMFGTSGSGDTSGYGGLVRTVEMPAPTARRR